MLTVRQLCRRGKFELISGDGSKTVSSVYCCDLLSVAMTHAPVGCAWVTVIGNMNSIAVSVLTNASCIIIAQGMRLDTEGLAKALQENVTVLRSAAPVFETAVMVQKVLDEAAEKEAAKAAARRASRRKEGAKPRSLYYDLHIHTCLSPCGDELMTPPNIVNMAYLKELSLIAVTDHNTARNARAVAGAAKMLSLPLTVIPGIEVTTAENIHVLCLFPDFDSAEEAGKLVESHLPSILNRPHVFGRQLVMDEQENVTEEISRLLASPTDIPLDHLPELTARYGGLCIPAHIDRPSGGILEALGHLPDQLHFDAIEIFDPERFYRSQRFASYWRKYSVLFNSDAHQLADISEPINSLELESGDFAGLVDALRRNS